MLSTDDIKHVWPNDKYWQRVVVLAQELAKLSNQSRLRKCASCIDHDNMEIPVRECCVYDRAHAILKRLNELDE